MGFLAIAVVEVTSIFDAPSHNGKPHGLERFGDHHERVDVFPGIAKEHGKDQWGWK